MMPSQLTCKTHSLKEALICFGLGLRDGFNYKIALLSFFWGALISIFWLIIFFIWYDDIQSAAGIVGSFIKKELLMPFFAKLSWVTDKTFSETGNLAATINFLSNFAGGFIASAFSFLVVLAIYALTVMLSLRAMLELLLLERIKKHCLKYYPTISSEAKYNLRGDLRNIAGSLTWLIIGGAICLIIPFFGPFLLFFLASYLNFRELCDDVLEGLADTPTIRKIIQENRLTMTLLGVSLAIFMLIPIIGFFAPGVMCAAACHFCMRRVKDLASPPNPDAAETD